MAAGRFWRIICAELVGLALEAEGGALDLLVVLEVGLEEPGHLHRRAGGAGDGHAAVAVGREHLLHGPVGDGVALGGPAVAGHDHAVGVADGHDRRAVGDLHRAAVVEQRLITVQAAQQLREAGPGSRPGSKVGKVIAERG